MPDKELTTRPVPSSALEIQAVATSTPLAFGEAGELRQQLWAHLQDPRIADPRTCLAIADFILSQRVAMVDTGESKRLLDDLGMMLESMQDQIDTVEPGETQDTLAHLLSAVRSKLDERKQHHHALDQLAKANREAMAAREAAARVETSRGAVIGKAHADAMAVDVCDLVRRALDLIDDPTSRDKVKRFISDELDSMRRRFAEV